MNLSENASKSEWVETPPLLCVLWVLAVNSLEPSRLLLLIELLDKSALV
jgi:hypothetical protein